MTKPALLIFVLLISFSTINSYRILGLFPHPGISHFHFFQPIMQSLAEGGHEVTVVSHFPDTNPPENYKDVPLSGLTPMTNVFDLEVYGFIYYSNLNISYRPFNFRCLNGAHHFSIIWSFIFCTMRDWKTVKMH